MTEMMKHEEISKEEQDQIDRLEKLSYIILGLTGYAAVFGITCYFLFNDINFNVPMIGNLPPDHLDIV